MIWQNPWAWLGLLSLAVPVLIHLLARRSARVQPFPTLRFLQASQLLQARRARLDDVPLLLLRIVILSAAVAALAQPLLLTTGRRASAARTLARAIVVDTSGSMLRRTPAGAAAVDVARAQAAELTREASTSVVIESADPADALAGAHAWLETQPGRREVTVLSDFQLGTLEAADFRGFPQTTGISLSQIEVAADTAPREVVVRFGDGETRVRVTGSTFEWRPQTAALSNDSIELLASAAERAAADATLRAARATSRTPTRAHSVAIVFPHHEQHAQLMRAAQPLNQPWMGDVIAKLPRDSSVTRFARAEVAGRERLVLFARSAPGTLEVAMLVAAVRNSLAGPTLASELEPEVLPAAVLTEWSRESAPARDAQNTGSSDGRWFWALALLLLAVEQWVRRNVSGARATAPDAATGVQQRVA